VNSFATLDGDYAAILESFYLPGARTWLVGPLSLASAGEMRDDADEDPEGCLPWLNERAARPGSMVYVSFGTQVDVTVAQLDELAHGLADSGHAFGEDISELKCLGYTGCIGSVNCIVCHSISTSSYAKLSFNYTTRHKCATRYATLSISYTITYV
jgi:hypothetical protein